MLGLNSAQIGPQGATALASALTKRALPSLEILSRGGNPLGNAGLAALLPAVRQLPKLKILSLNSINIGDEGVKALCKVGAEGKLATLEALALEDNPRISEAGAHALAQALKTKVGDTEEYAFKALQELWVSARARLTVELKASCEARGVYVGEW